jgi:excisionase family DNA binding protein
MGKQTTAPVGASFMTQEEVADFLRVSQRHVANLQRRGLLPCVRLGRRVIYPRDRVLKALEDISTKTTAEVLK